MKSLNTVLLVEDDLAYARLLRTMFDEQRGYHTQLSHVTCMSEAEAHIAERGADLILLDLGLSDAQGLGAIRRARAAAPRAPLVVLTGFDDEELAAEALQGGAQDYLIKGEIEARGLFRALRYAIERKAMEEALFREQERAQVTLNSIGEAVASMDISGKVTFLNSVAEQMTGWSSPDAAGRPLADVFPIVDTATQERIAIQMAMAFGHNQPDHPHPSCVLARRDGAAVPIEYTVAPIHNGEGETIGAVVVIRDVSAARAMTLQLLHSAEHDVLTGLPNRMLLNDRIRHAIGLAARHLKTVAVCFLDLDGFKHINDSLGHASGDQLLRCVARDLVDCVRSSDTVSRHGGDEFVVLLAEVERVEDAAIAAAKILQAVTRTRAIDQHEVHVTASIGVSVYPDDGADPDTLITHADTAMYEAKRAGRHRYQFFKPAMNVRAVERHRIAESLRHAVERREFALHFQAKVDLSTGNLAGAEALLRWSHPLLGLIGPDQFIPVAEDSGLIRSIGNWVLREACRQTRTWLDAGLFLPAMAVNVSAMEFRNDDFLDGVFTALTDAGVNASVLELELTESVLMAHDDSVASMFSALSAGGIRIAIDDFGTGYSSLSYLRKFPISTLKIDRSFINQITVASPDTRLVAAIIRMGQSLDLKIVAEGVETQEQFDFLLTQRCDEAQGYYFSPPLHPEQFARLFGEDQRRRRTGVVP
jgi:diguanylate cyclase (GGDEF)-like protein/PAS domain S-box-containing protein